mmetsp:Transcript_24415/g.36226  ORF Transcript_24415/g.36226 Transcript_24415/m.36226 type:complete len:114 (+) Transcript_24415:1938-2279(+)
MVVTGDIVDVEDGAGVTTVGAGLVRFIVKNGDETFTLFVFGTEKWIHIEWSSSAKKKNEARRKTLVIVLQIHLILDMSIATSSLEREYLRCFLNNYLSKRSCSLLRHVLYALI